MLTDNGQDLHLGPFRRRYALSARHSLTDEPDPIGRAPMERLNASSRPCSESGPTNVPTRRRESRAAALPRWLDRYNHRRRHGSLGGQARRRPPRPQGIGLPPSMRPTPRSPSMRFISGTPFSITALTAATVSSTCFCTRTSACRCCAVGGAVMR